MIIELRLFDLHDLTNADYCEWYGQMSDDKQRRVDGFRFAADKQRTVIGDHLARTMIAERFGIAAQDIVFDALGGKPSVVGLPVFFNISHSGDKIVCVVDKHPVGVDIEQIRPRNLRIVKRICTEEECRYIFGKDVFETASAFTTDIPTLVRFYEIWTAKEACAKYLGGGLADLSAPCPFTANTRLLDGYVLSVVTENT